MTGASRHKLVYGEGETSAIVSCGSCEITARTPLFLQCRQRAFIVRSTSTYSSTKATYRRSTGSKSATAVWTDQGLRLVCNQSRLAD